MDSICQESGNPWDVWYAVRPTCGSCCDTLDMASVMDDSCHVGEQVGNPLDMPIERVDERR
eukprot:4597673-Prorocentrum_lima.AAC.1